MPSKKKVKLFKIGRDAKNGEFIPVDEAKRRPGTTIVETKKKATGKKVAAGKFQ